jgi:hypothetical protein
MEVEPFKNDARQPTAEDKARARARLEQLFEQVDRFGQARCIDPVTADAAIDAAVRAVRSRSH